MGVDILIARHGQNVDNANGILNGHRDLPLTELGRQQARNLATGIVEQGIEVDAVYSSPLSRALETAHIVCRVAGVTIEPVVIPEMIERDFGVMTGESIHRVVELCSPNILYTDTITYMLSPEGAETFPRLLERGKRVLEIVREKQSSGNALLICHGDLGKMVYAAATGREWIRCIEKFPFWQLRPDRRQSE